MAAEQVGVENGREHRAKLALGIAVLPRGHAGAHEVFLRRGRGVGEIVAVREVVMHKQPAQFHAEIFLGERQVGQMPDDVVTVREAIRAGARGDVQIVAAGNRVRAVKLRRVRRAKAGRDALAGENVFRAGGVSVRLEVQRPDAQKICESRRIERARRNLHRRTGREGIARIAREHQLHRPAGPGRGHVRDVALVVAVVHAHGEEFHQLAAVILVRNVRRIATAGHGVEVDDHRQALGADREQVAEGAVGLHQRLTPARDLAPLQFARAAVRITARVLEANELVRALAPVGDEMVLDELREDFEQLPVGEHGVQHQPGLHVLQRRRAGAGLDLVGTDDVIRRRAEARLDGRNARVRQRRAFGEGFRRKLLIDVSLRPVARESVQQVGCRPVADAIQQRRGEQRVARKRVGAEVHEEVAPAVRRGPDEVRKRPAEILRPRMPEVIGRVETIRIDGGVGRERNAARAVGYTVDVQHRRGRRGVIVGGDERNSRGEEEQRQGNPKCVHELLGFRARLRDERWIHC